MNNTASINKIKFFFLPLIVSILMLFTSLLFSHIGLDPHHDGILYKPALDLAHGQMLFKKTFSQYGAFTSIIQALSIKIFGESILSLRIITSLFYAGISFILVLIWKRFISNWSIALSSFLLIILAPFFSYHFFSWSSVYALFFLCLSLLFAIYFYEKQKLFFLFLSGISCALTFWTRQPVGIILFIGMSSAIILNHYLKNKTFNKIFFIYSSFFLGNLLTNFIFLIWIIKNHAFLDWWRQSIAFIFLFKNNYGGTILHIPGSLFPIFLPSFWTILPIICIILFLKTLTYSPFTTNSQIKILTIFTCLSSWFQYYPISTTDHTYWASAPMLGLLIYFLISFQKEKKHLQIIFTFLLIFAFTNNIIYHQIYNGYKKLSLAGIIQIKFSTNLIHKRFNIPKTYQKAQTPISIKNLYLKPSEIKFYQTLSHQLNQYTQKYPTRGFLNQTPDLFYNTLLLKDYSFHPIKMSWKSLFTLYPQYQKQQSKYIKTHLPIIIQYQKTTIPNYHLKTSLPTPFPPPQNILYIQIPE